PPPTSVIPFSFLFSSRLPPSSTLFPYTTLFRSFLPVVMSKEVAYSRKTGRPFAVLAIDIDHFKSINDTHGHEAGDLVLQQVALLDRKSTRLNSSHVKISYAVFCLKKKKNPNEDQ